MQRYAGRAILGLSISSIGCVGAVYNFNVGDGDATANVDGAEGAPDVLAVADVSARDASESDATVTFDANNGDANEADGPDTATVCMGGGSCALGACQRAQYTCVDGGRVCVETGRVANGTHCSPQIGAAAGGGTDVCYNGVCASCMAGADCSSVDSCEKSTYDCSSGQAVCVDAGPQLDHTSCGPGLHCYGGICSNCVVAAPCTPADAGCQQGTVTSCANGVPACAASATPMPDGTPCGTNQVCSGGTCTTCLAPFACAPVNNPCHRGLTSCVSGISQCIDTGNPQPNDTPCSGTSMCFGTYSCQSGRCTSSNPVICPTSDQCHRAGPCDPTTGMCSNPSAPNGRACSTGDPCAMREACIEGVCAGGVPVVCLFGTCQADSGACR